MRGSFLPASSKRMTFRKEDQMAKVDKHGRPEYPAIPDLQPRLDEKNAALTDRLAVMEKQADAELARFGPAPEPKAAKSK